CVIVSPKFSRDRKVRDFLLLVSRNSVEDLLLRKRVHAPALDENFCSVFLASRARATYTQPGHANEHITCLQFNRGEKIDGKLKKAVCQIAQRFRKEARGYNQRKQMRQERAMALG